ncbi:class I SAM-dependent methyltransferase [Bacillus paramycoides]|uniref:class I SAM-dependent methyltransferase n=1 Tax=Bacillus paramycoides TaxID=2026194 RepID=UPI002242DC0B|nr:class I SAM-dependent methyltransferase [Bacillus paramycoides]
MSKYQSYSPNKRHELPEMSIRINLLVQLSKVVGIRDTPLFQLLLFSKIKNYIRFIVLRKLYENFDNIEEMSKGNMHHNIFHSFMDLGIQLGMISQDENIYTLNPEYLLEIKDRNSLVEFEDKNYSKIINKIHSDYKFIECVIKTDHNTILEKIMQKLDFVYIKEVLTYVQEINELDFFKQISPSFSEDFYTDLGELAFNIYTKENYATFISQKQFKSILDIGCGNGNYIDVHLSSDDKYIVGVERQKKVFEKLQTKYKDKANVVIHNNDIINLSFNCKFDMINMSYMLFYLTQDEKEELFKRLKEILHRDGSIVICQYYPNFEIYQEIIAKHNKDWNLISRYKYDICNSILQAEVVLNNMLLDFAQAEQWNLFLPLLDTCGFEVSEIAPADDTYYSYFITIKHKNGGTNDSSY